MPKEKQIAINVNRVSGVDNNLNAKILSCLYYHQACYNHQVSIISIVYRKRIGALLVTKLYHLINALNASSPEQRAI